MKTKWISVKERLPEKDQWVIGANDDSVFVYSMFQFNGTGFSVYGEPYLETRITFWMPIPKPPTT